MEYDVNKIVRWVKEIGEIAGEIDPHYREKFNRIATEITTVAGPEVSTKLVHVVDGILNAQIKSIISISKRFDSTLESLIDSVSYDPAVSVASPNKFLEYVRSLGEQNIKEIVSKYSNEIKLIEKIKSAPYVDNLSWDSKPEAPDDFSIIFIGYNFDLWKRKFEHYIGYKVWKISSRAASSIYSEIKSYFNNRINNFVEPFVLDKSFVSKANQLYLFLKNFDRYSGTDSNWAGEFLEKLNNKVEEIISNALPKDRSSNEIIRGSLELSKYVEVLQSNYEVIEKIGGKDYVNFISEKINQLIESTKKIDITINYEKLKKLNSELLGLIGENFDSSELDNLLEFGENLPSFIDQSVFRSYLREVALDSGIETLKKLMDELNKYISYDYRLDEKSNALQFANLYLKIKGVLEKHSECALSTYFLNEIDNIRLDFEKDLVAFFSKFGKWKPSNTPTPYDDLINEVKSRYANVFPNLVGLIVGQIKNYTKIKEFDEFLSKFGFKEFANAFGTDPVPHIAASTVMELFNNVEPAVREYLHVVNEIGLDVNVANGAVRDLRKSAEFMKRKYLSITKCPFNFSDNAQSIYENLHSGSLDEVTYLRLVSSVSDGEAMVLNAIAKYYSLNVSADENLVDFVGKVISLVESDSKDVPDELFFEMLRHRYPDGKPIVLKEIIEEVWEYKKLSMHLETNEILSAYLNGVEGNVIKDTPVEREYIKNAVRSL